MSLQALCAADLFVDLFDRFSTQKSYQFASSSVLIIVNADFVLSMTNENEKICQSNASKSIAGNLVDFGHTLYGKNSLDGNFLDGLKSVINLLSSIVEHSCMSYSTQQSP